LEKVAGLNWNDWLYWTGKRIFHKTLSEGEIFSGRFLASLHPAERDVLMSVVLVLIERGDIMLNVWGKME